MPETEPNFNSSPNFDSADFYERLGLGKDASSEEISNAYREAAKQTHPDMGGDSKYFKSVQEAFDTLNNPQKRTEYDRSSTKPENAPNFEEPGNSAEFRQQGSRTEKAPDMNGLVQAWKMIEEANIQLEKGIPASNIDEIKKLKRVIDRYIDYIELNDGSDKDFKMAESMSDELETVIEKHDDLLEEIQENELDKARNKLDDLYENNG